MNESIGRKGKWDIYLYGNIYIQSTYNNTIVTATDNNGNVLAWESGGSVKFKKSGRSTSYAAQIAAYNLGKKVWDLGIFNAHTFIKGVGNGRESSIKGLFSSGINILSMSDITPIPYNGCRPKKQWRL